jgi:hypothetical protein
LSLEELLPDTSTYGPGGALNENCPFAPDVATTVYGAPLWYFEIATDTPLSPTLVSKSTIVPLAKAAAAVGVGLGVGVGVAVGFEVGPVVWVDVGLTAGVPPPPRSASAAASGQSGD